uniref:Minor tail protein n=1 Tax=Microbacterium phage Merry TaxID=3144827 RepID=A0AAU7J8N0_9VIRU
MIDPTPLLYWLLMGLFLAGLLHLRHIATQKARHDRPE